MLVATDISELHNVKIYTYKELRIATTGFSLANKIGQGGFGSVYKVIDGTSMKFTKKSISAFFQCLLFSEWMRT